MSNEIRVIYNFVNTEMYQPMENRPNDEKRLMHISNFRPVKRVNDCIRILAEVLKRTPAHLYMVGDGPDRPEAHRWRANWTSNGKSPSSVSRIMWNDYFRECTCC